MEVEPVTTYRQFLSLESDWNALVEASPSDTVFLRHEWFKAWWLGFGECNRMLILLVRERGQIIGIAPLMMTHASHRGLPVRRISFIENANSPRSDFILCENPRPCVDAMVKYLKKHKPSWDVIHWKNIPVRSPSHEILKEVLRQNGILFGTRSGLRSPFIAVDSEWDTYFAERSRKFRKVLRNKVNRLKRLGAFDIEKHEQMDGSDQSLSTIVAISRNSWKARFGKDIAGSHANERFFRELTRTALNKEWLRVWTLSVAGQTIAYEYHLKYKETLHALRADFDESYRANHPGSVLDAHVVQSAFENSVKEYDLCGSMDPYKVNWTASIRQHIRFLAFPKSFYGALLYLLEFTVVDPLRKCQLLRQLTKKCFEEN